LSILKAFMGSKKDKYDACPLTTAMSVLGGKWKPVILGQLSGGKKRFGELKKLIPAVTQKMLTQQLRELEEDGLIHREIFKEIPPKVEYSLTEFGKTAKPILKDLGAWGKKIKEQRMLG
jgi:DNA-binding HxlR family transcriptional regulator